jgi:hypothetical protein
LNIHLHYLVLDGVYRHRTDGEPASVEMAAPSDEVLQTVLHKIITRVMKLLTRRVRRGAGLDLHGRINGLLGRCPC